MPSFRRMPDLSAVSSTTFAMILNPRHSFSQRCVYHNDKRVVLALM